MTLTTERIQSLSCWSGPVSAEPIPGGITNRNYLVQDSGRSYVVRLCEERSFLGIDRRNERVCQQAACEAGVSPDVVHYEEGILVSRYVEARTLCDEDVRDPDAIVRLAAAVRQLHDARFDVVGEMLYFCPFQTVRTYTATARRLGAALPADIDALLRDARQSAAEITAFHPVLCHNDLLAANILDDGNRLWLVDWEYAGIGNPLFDLASISANSRFSHDLEATLLEAYAGRLEQQDLREMQILKTVSLLREALWAMIQTVASDIDFDYVSYAEENFAAYKEARGQLDSQ